MNLDKLFNPESVAIVGASTKPGSVGNDIVKNLTSQGYSGAIFPVNPKADELYNLKCYPNLTSIGSPIDLAIIAIPAAFAPETLREAGELGVKAAVVISAGFKETGNAELEKQLKEVCLQYNIALVGPNCLGIINPEIKMNASFAALMPEEGSVAFISQSGALCTAVIDYAKEMGLGFSKFMSVGNKAVLDELRIIQYLDNDPKTKVIAMYAESLADPKSLIALTKRINRGVNPKPIITLKSGRTSAGASASASHTGALAGSDAAYDALFHQAGIIRAQSVSQLFNYASAFVNNPLPEGNKFAIITNAGGPGVLATDEAILFGLELAGIDDSTKGSLSEFLPEAANVNNPIDVLGDAKADRYERALEIVARDNNVNGVIVILTPQSMTEIDETAQGIARVKQSINKPIIVSFMGNGTVRSGVDYLQHHGIATCHFPEQAARSLAALTKFSDWSREKDEENFYYSDVDQEKVRHIFNEARNKGQKSFPEAEALEILRAYNFPLLKSQIVRSAEEAREVGHQIGQRLAMKIVSPDILHKTDSGGVMLNVDPAEVHTKYDEMIAAVSRNVPGARLDGILLMEMAQSGGLEFILGSSTDPALGQMIMVGLGGIYVEVFKDVAFGLAPITRKEAIKMLGRIKSKKLLEGVRGGAPLDTQSLIDTLGRLSQLLSDFPEIVELDINPLLVLPNGLGARALDARLVIR